MALSFLILPRLQMIIIRVFVSRVPDLPQRSQMPYLVGQSISELEVGLRLETNINRVAASLPSKAK